MKNRIGKPFSLRKHGDIDSHVESYSGYVAPGFVVRQRWTNEEIRDMKSEIGVFAPESDMRLDMGD